MSWHPRTPRPEAVMSFLTLLPELRAVIYEHSFRSLSLSPGDDRRQCPSILLVNKQVQDEARDALLKSATIVVWWQDHMHALGLDVNGPPFHDPRRWDDSISSKPIGSMRAALGSIRRLEVRSEILQTQASQTHGRTHGRDCQRTCSDLTWDDCFLRVFPQLRSVNLLADRVSHCHDHTSYGIQVIPDRGKIQNWLPQHSLMHLIRRIDGGFGRKYFEREIWKTKAEEAGIRMRWTLVMWLTMDVNVTVTDGLWGSRRIVPNWRRDYVRATMAFKECVLRFEV